MYYIGVGSMRERIKKYINNDYKFDKMQMIGIICLIIVISGIFGFLYEFIFYYFNGGMKEFYWRGGNLFVAYLYVFICLCICLLMY